MAQVEFGIIPEDPVISDGVRLMRTAADALPNIHVIRPDGQPTPARPLREVDRTYYEITGTAIPIHVIGIESTIADPPFTESSTPDDFTLRVQDAHTGTVQELHCAAVDCFIPYLGTHRTVYEADQYDGGAFDPTARALGQDYYSPHFHLLEVGVNSTGKQVSERITTEPQAVVLLVGAVGKLDDERMKTIPWGQHALYHGIQIAHVPDSQA